jgi:hypothetical protein
MRKAGLLAASVGLLWAASASAVPVYYSYGYFGEGRSYANGDNPTFTFTMEYDLDRQPVYMDANGNLVTQADEGLHTNPSGPFIADVYLGPNMVCPDRCGESLHLLAVSNTNIPEPATLGLLLVGAGLAVGMKRRKREVSADAASR